MKKKKKKPSVLLESLAKSEHIQWCTFSKVVKSSKNVLLPPEIVELWKKGWVPYNKLPEETKNIHRMWAKRTIHILKVFFRTHFKVQISRKKYTKAMKKFKNIGLDDSDIAEIYKTLNEQKGMFNAQER